MKRPRERAEIYLEIDAERMIQDTHWHKTQISDQQMNSGQFVKYIISQASASIKRPTNYMRFRQHMLRVAALAVAAVEWIDRREKLEGSSLSHY